MKTYVCDICNDCIDDVAKCVQMREIKRGGILSKKQKIHICKNCWFEIAKISRKKRTVKIPDNYTEFLSGSDTE